MKFSRLQILFLLFLFMGMSNHVMILPPLLQVASRDAWVSVLAAYVILMLWGLLLFLILKRMKGEELTNWVRNRAGKIASKGITLVFAIYFFVSGILSSYDFILLVKIFFLPVTSTWIVTGCFLLLCVWAAFKGFKVIVYMSAVLLPIVWALECFLVFSTLYKKEYSYIFPVLVNGYDPIKDGLIIVLGGSIDLLVLFLIQNRMTKPFSYFHLSILITVLLGLVLGPTIGSIATFGPFVSSNLRYPTFEQWRLVQLGRQVSHLDFLAIYQFLSWSIIKVSLSLYFLVDLFNIKTAKTRNCFLLVNGILFSSINILPLSDIWLQNKVSGYYYPVIFVGGFVLSLILFVISYLPKRKEVPI